MPVRRWLLIAALFVGLVPCESRAQQCYAWVVSSSPSILFANTGNFPPGALATVYLWFFAVGPQGMSAADISVVINPAGAVNVLAFNTSNGFLNAGSVTNPLLAVGGCPYGPVVAGSWILLPVFSAWELCLGGVAMTVNCEINPIAYPHLSHGFANGGAPQTCGGDLCGIVSVESTSWGMVKSLYR